MTSLERFSEADLQSIRDAVRSAEQRTGGEIVTYLVGRCDPYPEAIWRGSVFTGLFAVALSSSVHYLRGVWGGDPLLWMLLPLLAGLLIGALVFGRIPALSRTLIDNTILDRRVGMRAEAAFLEEEVFKTRDRTGILLFVALFEHRAVVLGDEGINRRVEPEEWQKIIDPLVAGLRSGNPTAALVHAVEQCGGLLERRQVVLREDDIDELPDAPRVRET